MHAAAVCQSANLPNPKPLMAPTRVHPSRFTRSRRLSSASLGLGGSDEKRRAALDQQIRAIGCLQFLDCNDPGQLVAVVPVEHVIAARADVLGGRVAPGGDGVAIGRIGPVCMRRRFRRSCAQATGHRARRGGARPGPRVVSSVNAPIQPPQSNPPARSSSGRPGACITPSSD